MRCSCVSLSPFLCSLQVSLNLWWCFATPGAKEDLKICFCNRKKKRKKKLIVRGIIVVDRKQIGKIYGLRETTLLNICLWQIRHSCVPYPDAAENSRMKIKRLRHSHEYEDLRILTKIAELTRKHYVSSENVRIDPENDEFHTWAITRHCCDWFDFFELFPIDRWLYFAGKRFLSLEVCSLM